MVACQIAHQQSLLGLRNQEIFEASITPIMDRFDGSLVASALYGLSLHQLGATLGPITFQIAIADNRAAEVQLTRPLGLGRGNPAEPNQPFSNDRGLLMTSRGINVVCKLQVVTTLIQVRLIDR